MAVPGSTAAGEAGVALGWPFLTQVIDPLASTMLTSNRFVYEHGAANTRPRAN